MQFELSKAVPVLERTPRVLRELLNGLPEEWTAATEGPETWSPFDVVGHLIHGERTDWLPRARSSSATASPARFRSSIGSRCSRPRAAARSRNCWTASTSCARANLERLRELDLSADDLRRTGRHPELGTVTLAQHLATWVAHDLSHVGQIVRVMGRAYAEAVGPWRIFLPMLEPRGVGTG